MNGFGRWTSDVYQGDRSGGPRRGCTQLQRSGVEGLVRAGPERMYSFFWTTEHTGPCVAAAGLWVEDGR